MQIGLQAKVRLLEFDLEWRARVARMASTIDPETRTVGVIVEVDEPYRQAIPGVRPPLVKEMFVEVELIGPPRARSLVIPRAALHEDVVYVVSTENRLQRRRVDVALVQPTFVTVSAGLTSGEHVIVSDLIPAIDGMLLAPSVDELAQARLATHSRTGAR